MEHLEGKVAFITGGGSGIGLGMAKTFAASGMKVVIADIDQNHLDCAMQSLCGFPAHSIRLDVTDRLAMSAAAKETEQVFGKVHVLCNNAGVNLLDDIGAASYDDWDWIMGVNLGGVVNGLQTFVPKMKSHSEGGHVVNTASMAAFIASGRAGIYCTSKFAVRGLSEALRWSLGTSGIGVSLLCPGLVRTAIYRSGARRPGAISASEPIDTRLIEELAQVHEAGMMPEEVGKKVLRAIQRNEFYIFPHPEFRDELRETFEEVLAAQPDEAIPTARLAFEEARRMRRASARAKWPVV